MLTVRANCDILWMQLFCDDRRAELRAEHPEAKMGELSKLLADAWRAVDPDDKVAYEAQAKVWGIWGCITG